MGCSIVLSWYLLRRDLVPSVGQTTSHVLDGFWLGSPSLREVCLDIWERYGDGGYGVVDLFGMSTSRCRSRHGAQQMMEDVVSRNISARK